MSGWRPRWASTRPTCVGWSTWFGLSCGAMPGRNLPGVRRWRRPDDRIVAVRRLLGQLHQEGVAQALEGPSHKQRVLGAFGGQFGRSNPPPLEAQLEQRGGTEVRGTAAQR